ncbi:MAG: hypothetical protein Kow0098_25570 [Ignavibacteriaceae bacterium]
MNNKLLTPKLLTLTGIILAAAIIRLIPHPPNFAPVAAVALFGGAYFSNKKLAFAIPLLVMFLTDIVLGLHSTIWAVYLSFALIVVIGRIMIRQKKVMNIIFASVTASVSFFIITNFAHWLIDPVYSKNMIGLVSCYTAAIPFFHYTLLSDLFFAGIMFGFFELMKVKLPVLSEIKVK